MKRTGALVMQADALRIPMRDESVDLIITSPPYFALRSYRDGGEHYDGQVGSEATPRAFLEALWAVMDECWRVLKPTGSAWINLGDKYAGSGGHNNGNLRNGQGASTLKSGPKDRAVSEAYVASRRNAPDRYNQDAGGVRPKSLMGLPWGFALGCINPELYRPTPGPQWILRAEVIWCLSGGAKVYARTPTGDRPIMLRDLVRAYQPGSVQLWNGKRWTQVLGWNRSADTEGALEVELRSGERIGCTIGHRWPTNRGLLRADELRIGDVIETCRLPQPEAPREPEGLPDDGVGWLVGLYLAEGSRSEKTVQIAGHIKETARHGRLARIAAAYDGTLRVFQTSENGVTCNLSGAVLRGIIDRYVTNGTAHTKRLSFTAWQRSDRFLAAVMGGYLSGDGHYDEKNDRWRLGLTANDELAADIRTLAARLGATLTLKRATATGFGRTWPIWRGEWRWSFSEHWNTKPRGEVVAVRYSRSRQFFDVGVADEPHTFALASGVLTHNSKPNGLPESVTERVRRSHEQWFHLVKEGRYYSAIDEIREAHGENTHARSKNGTPSRIHAATGKVQTSLNTEAAHPLGKLPGSVWTIPSEPLVIPQAVQAHYDLPDHFAAFPQEWPRRIILGWSPPGICTRCGEGRRPVMDADRSLVNAARTERIMNGYAAGTGTTNHGTKGSTLANEADKIVRTITGHACACDVPTAPTRPAVVLDPFVGTGTTVLVARALGRLGVGIDLSHAYCRLAQWRIWESGHAAKAEQRTWVDQQNSMFPDMAKGGPHDRHVDHLSEAPPVSRLAPAGLPFLWPKERME